MDEVHLIVFHVGPVQEFIMSARRSRDLWFGSWMLSELSKAAAEEIVKQNGGDVEWSLIFPAPRSLSELRSKEFNAANRIVARTRKAPAELGEAVRTQVLGRLREISDEAFSRVEEVADFDRSVAELQVDDLLEFFWASCPLKDDYAKSRLEAESLMAARKATRDFVSSKWGSPEDKSSLDGLRESVIPRSVYRKMSEEELRKKYRVRRGERLCGVGLLKRHGRRGRGDRFFSTSHVAAMLLLERLNESHRGAVDEYVRSLRGLGIGPDALDTVPVAHPVFGYNDGHLLFSERLVEFFDGEQLEQAQEALHKFLEKCFACDRPFPYYVLLHADGDHMGKIITHQESIEKHRALSRSASLFAQKVDPIVSRCRGSLVYAGGDDVLALLPLHNALECARALADAFRQQMSDFAVQGPKGEMLVQPTLSVGLAIVHHLEPLSEALELARQAEAYAKSVKGKNALAVTLSKRGGSEQTVGGTWGAFDQRLEWFIELYRKEEIPAELAYELRSLAMVLESPEEPPDDLLQRVLSAEVKRILNRKKAQRGSRDVSKEVIRNLIDIVTQRTLSVMQLADELIIAREFASAFTLAVTSLPDVPSGEGAKE
jgi:CRISPR-associated protein Cmr2